MRGWRRPADDPGPWTPPPLPDASTPLADRLRRDIAELLAERDTEAQRADAAEAALRAAHDRIAGLELTVAAYAGQAADRTEALPRIRSAPPPGRH